MTKTTDGNKKTNPFYRVLLVLIIFLLGLNIYRFNSESIVIENPLIYNNPTKLNDVVEKSPEDKLKVYMKHNLEYLEFQKAAFLKITPSYNQEHFKNSYNLFIDNTKKVFNSFIDNDPAEIALNKIKIWNKDNSFYSDFWLDKCSILSKDICKLKVAEFYLDDHKHVGL